MNRRRKERSRHREETIGKKTSQSSVCVGNWKSLVAEGIIMFTGDMSGVIGRFWVLHWVWGIFLKAIGELLKIMHLWIILQKGRSFILILQKAQEDTREQLSCWRWLPRSRVCANYLSQSSPHGNFRFWLTLSFSGYWRIDYARADELIGLII